MKRAILRKEFFGYTCYDVSTLTHSYINKIIGNDLLLQEGVESIDSDFSPIVEDGLLVAPIRVYYEVTKRCNLRCKHCFNISGIETKSELSASEVINILHGLKQNGVIDIRFTGGEFTQKDGWYEILSTAKKLGFIVSLNTNGVYDSLDIIEMLSALNLNQITISVDGRETSHNKLRLGFGNKNNFIEATDSIKKLSGLGCNIRINTVLNQLNIDDVPQLLDFAGTYCKEINFFAMRHIGNAINLKDDSLDRESFDNISKWISFAKRNYPSLHALYGHQVMNSTSISKNNPFNLKYGSPDGFTRFNLVDNGDIYAGGYTPYIKNNSSLLKLGNILKENYSLSKIWHFSPKLQWLRKESAKLKDICENCLLKGKSCPGGIFEMELQKAFGDIKRNPYCDKNLDFIDINSLPSI